MPIDIDYTEVPSRPDVVRVDIAANDPRGICMLEVYGAGRSRPLFRPVASECTTAAGWSGTLFREEFPAGLDVFISLCPSEREVPELSERRRMCGTGTGGRDMRHRDPPPPPTVTPTSPTRCPTLGMGDCSLNPNCVAARETLARRRDAIAALCQAYHRFRDQAAVNFALSASFAAAAAVAYGIGIAALATVPPPFGAVIAWVALALAIVMTLAAIAAFAAALVALRFADDHWGFVAAALREYRILLGDAAGVCVCRGCELQSVDRRLPDACVDIPGISL